MPLRLLTSLFGALGRRARDAAAPTLARSPLSPPRHRRRRRTRAGGDVFGGR
jgi:hypothetical protein